jgi:hypothetical protein
LFWQREEEFALHNFFTAWLGLSDKEYGFTTQKVPLKDENKRVSEAGYTGA